MSVQPFPDRTEEKLRDAIGQYVLEMEHRDASTATIRNDGSITSRQEEINWLRILGGREIKGPRNVSKGKLLSSWAPSFRVY